MYKRTMIASGIAMAVAALPVMAEEEASWTDDIEVSGELKNETAIFTKGGTTIGAASAHDNGDLMKSETSARLFINAPVGESSELHAELRPVRDGEAVDGMKGHEDYTQQDWLRELYVDTTAGEEDEISLRLGKQQVVWGTADGMKLLDIINPTDYREMAQNAMDESRIPVWMINAETDLEDGSNLQVVISQPKENVFAGLDRNIDRSVRVNENPTVQGIADRTYVGHQQGSAFIMKGVDSITGAENGFLNIVPDLGSVSALFASNFEALGGGTFGGMKNPLLNNFTVGAFTSGATLAQLDSSFDMIQGGNGDVDAGAETNFSDLNFATNLDQMLGGNGDLTVWNARKGTMTGQQALAAFGDMYGSNLYNPDAKMNSAFEYMDRTPFTTFDDFVMARSQYTYDMPSDSDVDLAMRVKRTLDSGLNYSLNYSYNYDKNPIINLSWRNDAGQILTTTRTINNLDLDMNGSQETNSAILTLSDGTNNYGGNEGRTAILTFEQTVKRAHNLGTAMDYAIDTESLGAVVLRGEFLYQKDVYSPVIDRGALSIGDLPAALTMQKGDRFKYVVGADITVMTNMMVSAQLIQDRNLDYVDRNTDWDGSSCTGKLNCGSYTTDYATMHLTNAFNKAEKNKEFYSLFFSKPFGAEQQHRWNNIFMFEENGGKWNRFDVEYSFNDELIGSFEYDKYWGDANTQFGQLEASSNLQLGLKYIF